MNPLGGGEAPPNRTDDSTQDRDTSVALLPKIEIVALVRDQILIGIEMRDAANLDEEFQAAKVEPPSPGQDGAALGHDGRCKFKSARDESGIEILNEVGSVTKSCKQP